MEIINNRRSVRNYLDQPIEKEKVELLLKAGMQAPSAGNQQPWEFVTVTDESLKERIADMSPYSKMAKTAPLVLVVLGNKDFLRHPGYLAQDLGACTQNIMLEATHLGLGTVWLGTYSDSSREKYLSDLLGLPKHIVAYSVIVVGYPKDENANHYVDRFDQARIHNNQYGQVE